MTDLTRPELFFLSEQNYKQRATNHFKYGSKIQTKYNTRTIRHEHTQTKLLWLLADDSVLRQMLFIRGTPIIIKTVANSKSVCVSAWKDRF